MKERREGLGEEKDRSEEEEEQNRRRIEEYSIRYSIII